VLVPASLESTGAARVCDLIVIGSVAINPASDASEIAARIGLLRTHTPELTARIDALPTQWPSLKILASVFSIEWVNRFLSRHHLHFEIDASVCQMDAGEVGPMRLG
jgi:hypothetical protein